MNPILPILQWLSTGLISLAVIGALWLVIFTILHNRLWHHCPRCHDWYQGDGRWPEESRLITIPDDARIAAQPHALCARCAEHAPSLPHFIP